MGWLGGCSALRSDFLLADTLTWFAVTAGLTTVEVLEPVITWFGEGWRGKVNRAVSLCLQCLPL